MNGSESFRPKNAFVHFGLLSLLVGFPLLATPARSGEPAPTVRALRIDEPPVLDGRLDDLCWQLAEPITDFVQSQPNQGAEPGFPAAVRVAYDAHTLYVGFEIHSGDPSSLIANVLQRDGRILDNDAFIFALDTFHDHRDAYFFIVNPAGTRLDGRIGDEGVSIDINWDGIWQVEIHLLEDGWSGEIALPLRELRFRETEDGTWGFASSVRAIAARERIIWPNYGKSAVKVSRYGHLTGLKGLATRQPVVFLPYLTQGSVFGQHQRPDAARRAGTWERGLGLDLRYSPTSALRMNLALNPDFATLETDQFLFNLGIDELFLPEKRPFFIEGTEIFQTPTRLLYTRRIGLGDQEMLAGGKLLGKTGSLAFGFMDVLTGDGRDPQHNFTALRLKQDLFGSSTIGLLAVSKDAVAQNRNDLNRAAGMDLNLQLSQTMRLVANLNRSQRAAAGEGYAGSLAFRYAGRLLNARDNLVIDATLEDVTADFDIQQIGFIRNTHLDRRGGRTWIRYHNSIKRRGLEQIALDQKAWYFHNQAGTVRVQDGFSTKFSVETWGRIRPGLQVERSRFFFPEDGERYRNTQRAFSLEVGPYPRFRGKVSYRTGDNFGSVIRFVETSLSVKPTARMTWTGQAFHLHRDPFEAAERSSTHLITVLGVDYLFTPNLYWRVLFQGNSAEDRYLVNSLVRYEFHPGSVLYLSYKETRDDRPEGLVTSDRRLLAKISYLWHR